MQEKILHNLILMNVFFFFLVLLQHSILDIRVPQFTSDRKTITMQSYLDTFPFPYYVIVRNLAQLPLILSDAMRQWFEMVSNEE